MDTLDGFYCSKNLFFLICINDTKQCPFHHTIPMIRPLEKECVVKKIIFLFVNQNISCRYPKEPSHGHCSFEHPKQMSRLRDKKIFTITCYLFFVCSSGTMNYASIQNLVRILPLSQDREHASVMLSIIRSRLFI